MAASQRLPRIQQAFDAAVKGDWSVWREDIHNNKFCMVEGISEESADHIIAVMREEIHKQDYWKERTPPTPS